MPAEHGRIVEYIGIAQDVTDRVQREASHHDVEEHLRFALEAAHVGVWEWDIATGATFWSATCEVMHGLAPGTFGKTFKHLSTAWIRTIVHGCASRSSKRFANAAKRTSSIRSRGRTAARTGSWRARTTSTMNTARQSERGITLDVTERHALEEQLKYAQGQRSAQ